MYASIYLTCEPHSRECQDVLGAAQYTMPPVARPSAPYVRTQGKTPSDLLNSVTATRTLSSAATTFGFSTAFRAGHIALAIIDVVIVNVVGFLLCNDNCVKVV
jgi:hypothetical protein